MFKTFSEKLGQSLTFGRESKGYGQSAFVFMRDKRPLEPVYQDDGLLDFLPLPDEAEEAPASKLRRRSKTIPPFWQVTAFLFTVAISSFAGVSLGSEMARQAVDLLPSWQTQKQAAARQAEVEETPAAPAEQTALPSEEPARDEPAAEETDQIATLADTTEDSEDSRLHVRAKVLNIRSGPGTTAPLLSQANAGEQLSAVRKVKGMDPSHPCWFEVKLHTGKVGYVACEFVGMN